MPGVNKLIRIFYCASLCAIGLTISAATANADGMSRSVSIKDAPISAPLWTGIYVGGQVGGAWADWKFSNAISDPGIGPFADPGFPLGDIANSGFVGGVHAGYNRQIGTLLVGVEADMNWADTDATRDYLAVGVGAGLPFTLKTTLESYGTVRARLGMTRDKLLLYATGGFAWGTAKASVTSPGQLAGPFSTSDKNDHTGWTAGLGADYMIDPNWIIGVEYKRIDLGRENYQFAFPLATTVTTSADLVVDELTVRMSRKF